MHALRVILFLLPLSLAACASVSDETAYFPAMCEVHQVRLQRDTVPIVYGLIIPDARDREASTRFPYANRDSLGGCVITPDSPTRAKVLYCPDCRKGESEFAAATK